MKARARYTPVEPRQVILDATWIDGSHDVHGRSTLDHIDVFGRETRVEYHLPGVCWHKAIGQAGRR